MTEPLCDLPIEDRTTLLVGLHAAKARAIRRGDWPEKQEFLGRVDPLITRLELCAEPGFPQYVDYNVLAQEVGRELASGPGDTLSMFPPEKDHEPKRLSEESQRKAIRQHLTGHPD